MGLSDPQNVQVILAALGVFGTLAGAIIGVVLTKLYDQRDEKDKEKKQVLSVRTLTSLEIDFNLEIIRGYWKEIHESMNEDEDAENTKRSFALRFIEMPPPNLSRDAYSSQMHHFAVALDQQELTDVYKFYNLLSRLDLLRNQLTDLRDRQARDYQATMGKQGYYGLRREFDKNSPEQWDECESIYNQLIAKGNPLRVVTKKEELSKESERR
jgi:hypothetical protein